MKFSHVACGIYLRNTSSRCFMTSSNRSKSERNEFAAMPLDLKLK